MQITEQLWDKFIDFIYDPTGITDQEIEQELKEAGIDTSIALQKVREKILAVQEDQHLAERSYATVMKALREDENDEIINNLRKENENLRKDNEILKNSVNSITAYMGQQDAQAEITKIQDDIKSVPTIDVMKALEKIADNNVYGYGLETKRSSDSDHNDLIGIRVFIKPGSTHKWPDFLEFKSEDGRDFKIPILVVEDCMPQLQGNSNGTHQSQV